MFKIHNKHTRKTSITFWCPVVNFEPISHVFECFHYWLCNFQQGVGFSHAYRLYVSRKTYPNSCLSNDKCFILRKWKYSGGTIESVGKKAGYLCRTHEIVGWKWSFTDFDVTFGNPVTGSLQCHYSLHLYA